MKLESSEKDCLELAGAASAERVKAMEEAYDRSRTVCDGLAEAIEVFEGASNIFAALAGYMDSGLWLQDYERDESGGFPSDLKRGVLSQDGLYDLLGDIERLRSRIRGPLVSD